MHFPGKGQFRIESSYGCPHKLEIQGFLWRNFNSQKTCVANSKVLTDTTDKSQVYMLQKFQNLCSRALLNAKEKIKTEWDTFH